MVPAEASLGDRFLQRVEEIRPPLRDLGQPLLHQRAKREFVHEAAIDAGWTVETHPVDPDLDRLGGAGTAWDASTNTLHVYGSSGRCVGRISESLAAFLIRRRTKEGGEESAIGDLCARYSEARYKSAIPERKQAFQGEWSVNRDLRRALMLRLGLQHELFATPLNACGVGQFYTPAEADKEFGASGDAFCWGWKGKALAVPPTELATRAVKQAIHAARTADADQPVAIVMVAANTGAWRRFRGAPECVVVGTLGPDNAHTECPAAWRLAKAGSHVHKHRQALEIVVIGNRAGLEAVRPAEVASIAGAIVKLRVTPARGRGSSAAWARLRGYVDEPAPPAPAWQPRARVQTIVAALKRDSVHEPRYNSGHAFYSDGS